MKKKVNFMCTAFRDGFQSVYGARVFTKDFMPAVAAAKEAGISHFEAGGGARFQSLYFYTNEDAFAMMDEFRRVAGDDADLQTSVVVSTLSASIPSQGISSTCTPSFSRSTVFQPSVTLMHSMTSTTSLTVESPLLMQAFATKWL